MITDRQELKYSDPSLNMGGGAGSDCGVFSKTASQTSFGKNSFVNVDAYGPLLPIS